MLFAGGVVMIVVGFQTLIQPLLGLLLLSPALVLRPRPGRLDPELPVLREADAPALFELLHRTADAVGVRRVEAVQFTADFSVDVIHAGLRRKRCLVLGLPLWAAHPPQQRIAAVAQALGRSAPGDVRNGAVVGSALESLTAGSWTMRTGGGRAAVAPRVKTLVWYAEEVDEGSRRFHARGRRVGWLIWLLRKAMTGTARLLLRLTRPTARRALLEADDAAARTASSQATVGALRDRRLEASIGREMHRLVIEKKTLVRAQAPEGAQDDFWKSVAEHAARLREQEDLAEYSEPEPSAPESPGSAPASTSDVSDTLRLARLAHAPQRPATITLDEPGRARVEDELRLPKEAVERLTRRDGVPLAGRS
ncbi:M48 family metallopeptidase [Streptomyces cyaneofuscatus]|uniref:M48 family metallopeptidase n=1 Tax=Streptomyces cyaneofuscatus TaxID=66883 RepID=UPI0036288304